MAELQRLKPLWSCGRYVAAKAATHKDYREADVVAALRLLP
ncbi:MAG: hypothetical protein WCD43_09325 [Candidatus Acidiferrales bacterium]